MDEELRNRKKKERERERERKSRLPAAIAASRNLDHSVFVLLVK